MRAESTEPTTELRARARRNRLALLGLFVVFFAPILVAYVLNVALPGWRPFGAVNEGVLVEPPARLPVAGLSVRVAPGESPLPPFTARWSLAVRAGRDCSEACEAALARTRQTRLALGKDAHRVERVLLVDDPFPAPRLAALRDAHPDLVVLAAPAGWRFPEPAAAAGGPGWISLVDPQGFLVLVYSPASAPEGPLDDLERLLKISKIG